jgi:pectinesterase
MAAWLGCSTIGSGALSAFEPAALNPILQTANMPTLSPLSTTGRFLTGLASALLIVPASAHAAEKRIVVAADGSGDYRTVQEAFAAVPENSAERTIILVRPGVYHGQKILGKNQNKVTLQGEHAETTVLTFNLNVHDPQPIQPRYKGTGVVILGDDFRADKLTFENTAGDRGQALALRIDGDRAVVTNSRMLGWQDTLMLNNGRHYFRDCYVEGRVDFIYGSGTSVFDHCEIRSKNGGYVTAASTPAEKPFGFVFLRSRLTGDPAPWVDPTGIVPPKPQSAPAQAYLGRPWRPYGAVTFIDCDMGAHIRPQGWHNWGKPEQEASARYAEYNSTGPGAQPEQRVPWAKQLSKADAERITLDAVLGGADSWNPLGDLPKATRADKAAKNR